MKIPILNGIYRDGPDLRVSYPVNLVPVPKQVGINSGYLKPADGVTEFAIGPGADRGGINWNNELYRVMGTKLVKVSSAGVVTVLGDVGSGGYISMDYSFDRLSIASSGSLYYFKDDVLTKVTDPDLGLVIDQMWIAGYFMTTDGTSLVVTELNDPTAVSPLKYGSSEVDPDPIVAIKRIRNEAWAINRHTIEVFGNVGGSFFPFARIDGAQIQKGCIGTHACCIYADMLAFIGGGRNEALGIHIGANSQTQKISTDDIDSVLASYADLSGVLLEARNDNGLQHLYVHLPDRTLVYDIDSSKVYGEPVWFVLTSSIAGFSEYKAQNFVFCYGKWLSGYGDKVGLMIQSVASHYGASVRWEVSTPIVYNDGKGAIFHSMELICGTGRMALGSKPVITTSYSNDGISWSQAKTISVGTIGNTVKRLVWFSLGMMRNLRIQRFQGDSDSMLTLVRLEAEIEALTV